ncbi:WAS/WASL-interacting protein family member 3-like isoform X2 [Cetorhinus maximus]
MPMPPLPPPLPAPPPGAPPLPSAHVQLPKQTKGELKGRSALLGDIHKGLRLRKVTQVNDRSAPIIDKPKIGNGALGGGATPAAMGGLFQGGFPALRPTGQRDASERGSKPAVQPLNMKTQTSRYPVQNDSTRNDKSASNQLDLSKVQRAIQGHLNMSAAMPPPLPVTPPSSQSKSLSVCPSPTPSPSSNNKPTKTTRSSPPPVAPSLPPPPPPPPPMLASVTPFTFQYTQPPPSPPPSHNFQDQTSDFMFPAPPPPSLLCIEDSTDFPLPPLPPPPLPPVPSFTPYSKTKNALPPPPFLLSNIEVPPPLPPKLPSFSKKPSMSSISPPPPPPTPPPPPPPPPPPFPAYGHPGSSSSCSQTSYASQLSAREGPARSGVHNSVGKLAPPPLPPVRSPSTELTSRSQHSPSPIRTPLYSVPPPPPPPPPPLPLKVRQGLSIAQPPVYDDFESKYNFHSVEDLPPPDEYKSFPRTYPSKQPRVSQKSHRATTPLR